MVWSNLNVDQVQKADINGVGITAISSGVEARGVAIDEVHGKVYWTKAQGLTGLGQAIQRSNLDGSAVETLLDVADGISTPVDIRLDVLAGKLYWTDVGNGAAHISRANLDGTGVELVVDIFGMRGLNFGSGPGQTREFSSVWGLALDPAAQRLYWTDFSGQDIHSADFTGGNVSAPLVSGLVVPRGIALDLAGGRLYWAEAFHSEIWRAGLDGSNPELILDDNTGVDEPFGVFIDPGPAKLYWTNSGTGEIRRSDLNGLNGELLVSRPEQDLIAIAIEAEPAINAPALNVPALTGYGLAILVCALIGVWLRHGADRRITSGHPG